MHHRCLPGSGLQTTRSAGSAAGLLTSLVATCFGSSCSPLTAPRKSRTARPTARLASGKRFYLSPAGSREETRAMARAVRAFLGLPG